MMRKQTQHPLMHDSVISLVDMVFCEDDDEVSLASVISLEDTYCTGLVVFCEDLAIDMYCSGFLVVCKEDDVANSTFVDDSVISLVDMYCFGLVVFCEDDDAVNSTSLISLVDMYCTGLFVFCEDNDVANSTCVDDCVISPVDMYCSGLVLFF